MAICLSVPALGFAAAAAPTIEREPDGMAVHMASGELRIQVLSDTVVRIEFSGSPSFFSRTSIDRVPLPPASTSFKLGESREDFTLTTAKLRVIVDRETGSVSFFDTARHQLLSEVPGSRTLEPATVQGESTFHIHQKWREQKDESLYGLGQMQLGSVDIKGYDLDLWQHNTNVVVPFLVSSNGYGIFWDNTSFTRFGDLRPFEAIPAVDLYDAGGEPGGLTVTPADGSETPRQTADITLHLRPHRTQPDQPEAAPGSGHLTRQIWVGSILAPTTGDYQFQAYSNGGIKVWLDGNLAMNHWRQNWLTEHDQIRVHLEAGHKYPIKIENDTEEESTLEFKWKTPAPDADTSLWSHVGDGIDYYFVYGPSMDKVIDGYRMLTGKATMLPNWVFGLWQSRQRYETAEQSLDVVKQFRERKIPFDNIVQDWQYWRPDSWGSHEFDPTRFPDPEGWIKAIHAEHAHVMISVWGKFNPNTENAKEMLAHGYLYMPNVEEHVNDWIGQPYTFYDAFNPGARKLYWSQINSALFSKGIDAWWEDATEPDLTPSPPTLEGQRVHMNPTAMGTASRVMNGYALMNSKGMYEGQRSVAPNQRVFILTRSGFAGIQRYGTATWSGDTTGTWTAMKKQIAAGLGFCISGTPYWTMDIGGYTMESRFSTGNPTPENADEWRELNARWFEFGAFCPLTRLHGELIPREPWAFGGDSAPAYQAIVKFDKIRYRLLPYIYSLAGEITQDSGTMMRPLVMDFQNDAGSRGIADEYMFGPAFLVAPVTTYQARSRSVYLPPTDGDWYDFWTGASVAGGRTFDAPAPYDAMPLFIRAGSIIPNGPDIQYTGEKPADPITLFIYTGANGAFTLYEDDGLTYNYEHGDFARIPITWDNATQTLAIGKREGKFTGMLAKHTFNIVLVNKNKPVGFSFTPTADQTVTYTGSALKVTLK